MTTQTDQLIAMQKYIRPLNMNGLNGRMLKLPAPSTLDGRHKREILLVYGHHASIERMYGIAEAFNEYGTVTMPDLPGCGGMESFYKIGMKPNLDTMADYLASFVKLRYRGKTVTIAGMSLGFAIVTRMLQRYPELIDKVDLLISIVGFSHKYDFSFKKSRITYYKYGASFFSKKLPSLFFYNVFLHPSIIRAAYSKTHNAKKKMANLSKEEKRDAVEFEVNLWRQDDIRTYMQMVVTMLTINNCNKQINLPVHHISVSTDQYFDHTVVEQHMRIIFTDFTEHEAIIPNHAPSILATKEEAGPFIPKSVRKIMKKAYK
jgi:alpha-beta hydrolase superfamily lysophospholipase